MSAPLLAIVLILAAASSLADTLTTPSYKITIVGCDEYVVSCDTVKYVGVSRKTGKSIALTGRTVHTTGADGVTPSRFLGYEFKNGRTTYFVGEEGELRVTQDSKILIEERGTWK
jgi:hypothetical protein